MKKNNLTLSILILNYNTKNLLSQCLNSIESNVKNVQYEIIVVDNNSSDGSVKYIKQHFSAITIIANTQNVGFTKANNQAAIIAKGKYLLILNSDTIVHTGSLTALITYLDENKNTGIVGPKLLNPDKSLQLSCGIHPNLLTEFLNRTFLSRIFPNNKFMGVYKYGGWDYTTKSVDWVTGACLLIRKNIFQKINGFDENIFMFYEDVDLCFRLKKLGHDIIFFPDAQVTHIHGGSWINYREVPIFYSCKSALYFFKKHYPRWQTLVLRLWLLTEILISYIFFIPFLLITQRDMNSIKSRIKGYNACLRYIFS